MTIGPYRLSDLWSAFRRRFWLLVLAVAVIAPVALAIAYFLPPRYRSEALILVESQQISLVESTVTVSAAERLQRIQQKLMTRETLLEMITRFDLYAERSDLSLTSKIDLLRDNTRIEMTSLPGRRPDQGMLLSFTISFTASDGPTAARVANEFVSKVISENRRERTDRASGTLSYFQSAVEELSGKLAAVEGRIARFQNENERALPDSLEFRREELSGLQARQFEREQARLGLVEQKRALEQALLQGGINPLAPPPVTEEERNLQALRNTLVQRSAVLADSHPEIVALKRRIEALERVVTPAVATGEEANPAAARMEAEIALLAKQIALLDEQAATDEARRLELEASIARTPEVAMEINRLEREREQLQRQYTDAVTRLAAAASGERLEVTEQAERFEVAEQPLVPERPYSPNRPLIAAGGVVFSVLVGLALMVLTELMNPSIRTAFALEYRTGLKPVVSIPYVRTRRERQARLVRLGLVLAVLLVAIPVALYAVDRFWLPLDALAQKVADRLGLDGIIRLIEIRLGR